MPDLLAKVVSLKMNFAARTLHQLSSADLFKNIFPTASFGFIAYLQWQLVVHLI